MALVNPFKELEGAPNVYTTGRTLMTVNAARDRNVYGERLVEFGGVQYRSWDPMRSKLAALMLAGGRDLGLDRSSRVLYLGAASGTTASHVSDVASSGIVYCVEISPRSFRDLVGVCESRGNMIPIMADASRPEEYSHMVEGVELVYQDIAQRDQADIFARNMRHFDAGRGILMLKSRSVDVNRDPGEIFADTRKALESEGLRVREVVDISRHAADHAAFVVSP